MILCINFNPMFLNVSEFFSIFHDLINISLIRLMLEWIQYFSETFCVDMLWVNGESTLCLTSSYMIDSLIFRVFPKVPLRNFLCKFVMIIFNFMMFFFKRHLRRRFTAILIMIYLELVRLCKMTCHLLKLNS